MILPIIHMNGTSPETLLEVYRMAMDAVANAQEALSKVEFRERGTERGRERGMERVAKDY